MERPGAAGGKWWREQYQQYKRWPVPRGKDAGEAFAAGIDLRMWVMAGLPPAFHDTTFVSQKAVPKKSEQLTDKKPDAPSKEKAERQRLDQLIQEKKVPKTKDVIELQKILRHAEGFFRIYDHGNAVGPVVSPEWSRANQEKRTRLAWLLFNSESIAHVIENLADGLYGPDSLAV
jgi:hypothetical protein